MFKDNGFFSCGVMMVFPKDQHAIHLNCIVFGIQLSLFYRSAMLRSLLLAIINFPNDLRSIFQTLTIQETSVIQIHIMPTGTKFLGKIIKFLTESVSPAVSTCEHFCTFAFTLTYHD